VVARHGAALAAKVPRQTSVADGIDGAGKYVLTGLEPSPDPRIIASQ
jgi:hypothetical protein